MNTERTDIVAQGVNVMSEKNFQTRVIQLAKFHGFELVYHTHNSQRSAPGFPDLVMVSTQRKRILYRELKAAKGRVTADQQEWLNALARTGQDAGVWRPADLLNGRIISELRCN
ncbi:VRR-NUC domain-containing protein [Paeniglutamicibacter sp. NPDC012692]|uniref:VRR-NUC domain-containing protein n=1 Tax=Paeniglutamicibacter sp. NPDC012692 TaxID=3364388 RepID=UPI0036B758EF